MKAVVCFISLLYALSMSNKSGQEVAPGEDHSYNLIKSTRRPETYYTQGLVIDGKFLYESGGLYGESVLVKMVYPTLEIDKKIKLDDKYFAEGLGKCGNTLYQLTWHEKDVFLYDMDDLKLKKTITIPEEMREGWGLAEFENNKLIATDGTNKIFIISCEDFKVKSQLIVTENDQAVYSLNALAYDGKYIYANIYMDDSIIKIDPASGKVLKRYKMKQLIDKELENRTLDGFALMSGDVLNGIAYDKEKKEFLVTGKRWGYYYNIVFN
jgi:glutamine cyclotransferase